MEIVEHLWKIIPAGSVLALLTIGFNFYRRHLLDVHLHVSSGSSYCFVIDSERNSSKDKSWYHAHLKATVDISTGKGLGHLEDVHFCVLDSKNICEVGFSKPRASEEVQKFFDAFGKTWQIQNADGTLTVQNCPGLQSRLTAKGTAQWPEPFANLPGGGYKVFMVLVLKRFFVVVPCRFASLNDDGHSSISSSPVVYRRRGHATDTGALLNKYRDLVWQSEGLCRLQLAILDFDFLPRLSYFKSLEIKKDGIEAIDGTDA